MDWKKKVPGCFGAVDQIFAGHPMDEQRARELRETLIKEGVPYVDLEDAMLGRMWRKGCGWEHIQKQMKHIEKMYKGKLP